ncbi:hypothetical protein AB0O57_29195 [Streptomyces sp. NPDC091201]|uniref:hypothetical protein n=1 Tax=Streptomyces sp. NPDC091201 TaxID=3155190 RepID=UPI0034339B20
MTAVAFREMQARRTRGRATPSGGATKPRRPVDPGPASEPDALELPPLLVGLAGVGRVWTLLMPYSELLTSNQRLHHMAVHRIRKRLRADAAAVARAQLVPGLDRAAVFYALHPRPINRKRDPGNWAPSAKAYVDGFVDAGVLPDDDHVHLLGPNPVMGPPVASGAARMSLVIAELPPL